jgi:hypothetical protein
MLQKICIASWVRNRKLSSTVMMSKDTSLLLPPITVKQDGSTAGIAAEVEHFGIAARAGAPSCATKLAAQQAILGVHMPTKWILSSMVLQGMLRLIGRVRIGRRFRVLNALYIKANLSIRPTRLVGLGAFYSAKSYPAQPRLNSLSPLVMLALVQELMACLLLGETDLTKFHFRFGT